MLSAVSKLGASRRSYPLMIRLPALLTAAVVLITLYHFRIYMPVVASVAILGVVSYVILRDWRAKQIGPMMALLYVVYALPFIHLIPYIWFNFDSPPPATLWGIAVNPYMIDREVINLVGMIGATGALGFAAGITAADCFSTKRVEQVPFHSVARESTMPLVLFMAFLVVSFLLSWLAAPTSTIFTAAYTESTSRADEVSFNSAALVSYTLIIVAIVDCLYETSPRLARLKRRMLITAFGVIVFWFQILRGSRESFPVMVAAALLYFVWGRRLPGGAKMAPRRAWFMVTVSVLTVFCIAYFVGALRSVVAGVGSTSEFRKVVGDLHQEGSISTDNILTGTWSAVLLTPLSVAGDDINRELPLKKGATYVDFVLSLVPGPIAKAVGYARPIDAEHGPAWEMRYGLGGTHATVVPFMNFRLAGVLVVIALWAYGLHRVEGGLGRRLSMWRLSFVAVVTSASPHWLWYGEKYIITAIILWFVIVGAERLCVGYLVSVSPLRRVRRYAGVK